MLPRLRGDREHLPVLGLRHIIGNLAEVEADTVAVGRVDMLSELVDFTHLHEQVDGLRLGVVLHEEGLCESYRICH